MRRRKVPDYGEFAGFGLDPIDAPALAVLEALLCEWNTAPDADRKRAAEDALRELLQSRHGVNGFTTSDGRRVEFAYRVHLRGGVSEERLAGFLTANGQRAHGRAEEWAKWLLTDGRSIPEDFDGIFAVRWFMTVQ